tara:strand:- start:200 stop:400 length:201 start_codon:yes stop_codon:yes gene_type:complete
MAAAVVLVVAVAVVVVILVEMVLVINPHNQELDIMEILVDVVIVEAAADLVLLVGLMMVVMVGHGI